MLYIFLKNIIETTIIQYACQGCQGKVEESSVRVTGIGESLINLDITCPHCQSHAHIHAEVANIATEMLKTDEGKALLRKVMKNGTFNENTIKDADITSLMNELSSAHSIEDLLK